MCKAIVCVASCSRSANEDSLNLSGSESSIDHSYPRIYIFVKLILFSR